ncbi:MAG TPA: lipase family protein [Kineosporiaceae bacterium]|nr:lipase family protein [Kineosporiaceae bacterium]
MKRAKAAVVTVVVLTGLVVGLVCVVALSPPASAAGITCDVSDRAIYTAPESVTAAPGTLLACRSVTLTEVPGNISMRAWKVQYVSTDVRGQKIAVSGTIAVPTAAWIGRGARPVIAFHPGTLGLGPQCAFSKQIAGKFQDEYEGDQLAAILKAGWAVAATDGVGYLTGQTHTYVVGANAGHALLDIARTSFTVPGGGLSSSAKVGLWGYSEGGAASLWAAQLASTYAPELQVAGDAAGGVPGDLKVTAAGLNGGAFAGFLADAAIGVTTAYPSLPFASLLNDTGRKAVAQAKTLCLLGTVGGLVGAKIEDYTTDRLTLDKLYRVSGTDGMTWGQALDAQKLGVDVGPSWSPTAKYRIGFPVLQYRGLFEEVIPTATEDATRAAYCRAGVTTQWNTYPGDHLTTDSQAISDTVTWFTDRFAGRLTLGNC